MKYTVSIHNQTVSFEYHCLHWCRKPQMQGIVCSSCLPCDTSPPPVSQSTVSRLGVRRILSAPHPSASDQAGRRPHGVLWAVVCSVLLLPGYPAAPGAFPVGQKGQASRLPSAPRYHICSEISGNFLIYPLVIGHVQLPLLPFIDHGIQLFLLYSNQCCLAIYVLLFGDISSCFYYLLVSSARQ